MAAHHINRVGVVQRQSAGAIQVGQGLTLQILVHKVNAERCAAIALAQLACAFLPHRHIGVQQQFQLRLEGVHRFVGKPVQTRLGGIDRNQIGILRRQADDIAGHQAFERVDGRPVQAAIGFEQQFIVAVLARGGFFARDFFAINGLRQPFVQQLGIQQLAQLKVGEVGDQMPCLGQGARAFA